MPFVCVSICSDSMFMCIDLDCGLEDLKLWCFNLELLSDFFFVCVILLLWCVAAVTASRLRFSGATYEL